jgi:WD40 repeat protein
MSRHSKAVRLGLVWIAALSTLSVADAQGPPTRTFESRKYGVTVEVPKLWRVDEQHTGAWEFAFLIPQPGRDEVSLVSCRVWIAEENLEAARAALEADERDNNGIGGPRKIDIRIVDTPHGRRLDVLREDLEDGRVVGHQRNVSLIANRQRYEFSLWAVDEKQWPQYDAAFKAILDSVKFTPPDTGAFLVDKARNRWLNHHNHVAIDLPEGWAPVLNPVEGDQFWATGPAHGAVWPHNYLKVSRRPGKLDIAKLAESRPDELQNHTVPPQKILKCGLVKQGKTDALESIFSRFSETAFERQFHIDGFNYEVSFTIESRRFNDLSPVIRECLDSFQVIPQPDPIGGTKPEDRRRGDVDLLGWGSWSTQGFRVRTLGRRPLRIGLRLSNYVRSITFAPDGYTLASADEQGFIKIWDTQTGRVRSTFRNPPVDGLPHILQYVAFSPDGKTLAAGSSDRKLRIWDPATGKARVFPQDHDGRVLAIAFSPDGLTLASGGDAGVVRLWDVPSGTVRLAFSGHADSVVSLAFSPDGRALASGGSDNAAKIWDTKNGQLLTELRGPSGAGVTCVRFHEEGRILATGGLDNTARIWDITNARELKRLVPDCVECCVYSVAFSAADEILATTGPCGVITLWDYETGQKLKSLHLKDEFIECLEFSRDGKSLAATTEDELIYVIGVPSKFAHHPKEAGRLP